MSMSTLLTILLFLFCFIVARIYFLFFTGGVVQKQEKDDTDEETLARANKLFKEKRHKELQKFLKRELPKRYKSVELRSIMVNSYYVSQNYKMAALHLGAILELDPSNYAAKGMLADCLQANGQVQKAIATYEDILEENPDEIKAIKSLAELYQMMNSKQNMIKYLKLISEKPQSSIEEKTDADQKLARVYHEMAEYDISITYYDKIQEYYPNDIELMRTRVELYSKLQNWEKCIEIYNKILSIEPDKIEIYEKIAQMKFNQEKWNEAYDLYSRLIDKEEVGSKGYLHHKNRIAEISINQGKSDVAINMLTELIKKYPTEDSLAFTLAQAYLSLGDYEKAVALYTNLMENLPQDQLAIIRRHISNLIGAWAEDLFSNGSYNQAFDKFFLALKYNEENSEIYYKLGASNYSIKSFGDAISHFKRAIAINPQEAKYYLGLGYSMDEVSDYKNAKNAFKDAISIDPLNIKARNAYAITLAKEFNLETSLEEFLKVLEQTPNDPDLNYNIGLNYEMLGDDDSAMEYYIKTLKINSTHQEAHHNASLLLGREITNEDIAKYGASSTETLEPLENEV